MSAQPSLPSPELLRLSVEQYEAMGRAGILNVVVVAEGRRVGTIAVRELLPRRIASSRR
jgi:hypothetical protein